MPEYLAKTKTADALKQISEKHEKLYDQFGFEICAVSVCLQTNAYVGTYADNSKMAMSHVYFKRRAEDIDPRVSQTFDPPIKCWVYDTITNNFLDRWLAETKENHFYCYANISHGCYQHLLTSEKSSDLIEWDDCTFEEPKKLTMKVVKWENIWEVPKHLWCNVLFRKINEPVSGAKVLYPAAIASFNGNIIGDLVYLPQGSALNDKWFKMEHYLLPDGTTLPTDVGEEPGAIINA